MIWGFLSFWQTFRRIFSGFFPEVSSFVGFFFKVSGFTGSFEILYGFPRSFWGVLGIVCRFAKRFAGFSWDFFKKFKVLWDFS